MTIWIITDSAGKFIGVFSDLNAAKRSLYQSLTKAGVTIVFSSIADIQTVATCSNGAIYTLMEYAPISYPAQIV